MADYLSPHLSQPATGTARGKRQREDSGDEEPFNAIHTSTTAFGAQQAGPYAEWGTAELRRPARRVSTSDGQLAAR